VIIVTGFGGETIEASVEARRSLVVTNPDYRRGNMSSLFTAVESGPEADAFVLVPGDQPTMRTSVLNDMVALWQDEAPWGAVTDYRDRSGHPMLLSADAVEELRPLAGEKVLGRLFLDTGDDRVVRLHVPFDAPRDVNTPEDYEELLGE
jgi:CTP:molybdopterin cytidylyltransferase MocA